MREDFLALLLSPCFSGSDVLAELVAYHPDVFFGGHSGLVSCPGSDSTPHFPMFDLVADRLKRADKQDQGEEFYDNLTRKLIFEYCDVHLDRVGKKIFLDATTNYMLDQRIKLLDLFPNVKAAMLFRDPRTQWLARKRFQAMPANASGAAMSVESFCATHARMWKMISPLMKRIPAFRAEDLIGDDQTHVLTSILMALGVAHDDYTVVSLLSRERERAARFERLSEEWREGLPEEEIRLIEAETADFMATMRYSPSVQSVDAAPRGEVEAGVRHYPVLGWHWVDVSENIGLELEAPRVSDSPVLRPDKPWETLMTMYTSVLPAPDGGYYAFYRTHPGLDEEHPPHWMHMCLARSKDGEEWEKSNLGIHEWGEHADTNIVVRGPSEMTVCYDAMDEKAPYKALSKEGFSTDNRGLRVWSSADGVRWTRGTTNVLPFHCDGSDWGFWDPRINKYSIYFRAFVSDLHNSNHVNPHLGRSIARIETRDLDKPWPLLSAEGEVFPYSKAGYPQVAAACETNVPIALSAKEDDIESVDFYDSYVDMIDGGYVMMASVLANRHPYPSDIRLATSVDGESWSFPSVEPYISLDPERVEQTWLPVKGKISEDPVNDYYFAVRLNASHSYILSRTEAGQLYFPDAGGVYRIKQRRGGFLFLQPTRWNTLGRIVSKELVFVGRRTELRLNINASVAGAARVGLLDAQMREIPGFGVDDCDPVRGNSLGARVTWHGRSNIAHLSGVPIRLDIRLVGAKLYGFKFE